MRKSYLVPGALLPALALAAMGCAHQPATAASGDMTVMQAANQMGYNIPKVVNGRTLYCQNQALTGTLVPKLTCIDSDQVIAMERSQGDELKHLQQPPMSSSSRQ